MKPFLLLSSLIFFHFFACSQPKISKITWIGENNQYLNLSKKKPTLQQGVSYKQFERVKYGKGDIILSGMYNSIKIEQKYKVVRFTQDTLILMPKGKDVFTLCEMNEQNQYVFVNSMLTYKFASLYCETSFNNFDNPKGDKLKFILYIDSAKNSRYEILEIGYSDQVKKINGFTCLPVSFADELGYFVCEYIELRANINVPWRWRVSILRRKV